MAADGRMGGGSRQISEAGRAATMGCAQMGKWTRDLESGVVETRGHTHVMKN